MQLKDQAPLSLTETEQRTKVLREKGEEKTIQNTVKKKNIKRRRNENKPPMKGGDKFSSMRHQET